MKNIIFKFGLLAVLCLALLELSKYSVLTASYYQEVLVTIAAVGLIALGFIVSKSWQTREDLLKESFVPDHEKLSMLKISNREYDVLKKMADGLSNNEIGEFLFVSENTVKTHVSNLFSKLNVKRRTEAIKKGKEYGII